MDPRPWARSILRKLHTIGDSPHSIALGFAIGVFFGFGPLFGLKTLLSILCAWLLRSNKLAAVIGVTLHDVILPFVPVLLRIEYQVGFWLTSHPHHLPAKLRLDPYTMHRMFTWTSVFHNGGTLLLGSVIVGAPFAVASYYLLRAGVKARRRHKEMHSHGDSK